MFFSFMLLSGCDTTSVLFSHGKMKYCRILQNAFLIRKVQIFKDSNAARNEYVEATKSVFLAFYGGDPSQNLDVLRQSAVLDQLSISN